MSAAGTGAITARWLQCQAIRCPRNKPVNDRSTRRQRSEQERVRQAFGGTSNLIRAESIRRFGPDAH